MFNEYLKVEGLCGYAGKKTLFEDISFSVSSGLAGILGENGAGKTSLFKGILGLDIKTKGKISVFGKTGKEYTRKDRYKHITYIPQESAYSGNITAGNFSLLGSSAYLPFFAEPKKEDIQMSLEVFEKLGISSLYNRTYNSLSGGEKKLCYIAQALLTKEPLAFLDEPCSNLDYLNTNKILTLLKNRIFPSCVITLHDPNLAYLYCDKVIILHKGHLIDTIDLVNDKDKDEKFISALKKVYGDNVTFDSAEKYISWKEKPQKESSL